MYGSVMWHAIDSRGKLQRQYYCGGGRYFSTLPFITPQRLAAVKPHHPPRVLLLINDADR